MRLPFHAGFTPIGDYAKVLRVLRDFGANERSLLVTRTMLNPIFDLPIEYRATVGSSQIPDYATIVDEDHVLILLRGMSATGHAEAYIESILGATQVDKDRGTLSIAETWAALVLTADILNGQHATKPVTIVAHSMGSVTATAVKRRLLAARPGRTVRTYTFGAPRSVFRRGMRLGNEDYWRYVLDGDPVPWIPPQTAQLAWGAWNLVNRNGHFDALCQPAAMLRIDTDAQIRIIAQSTGAQVRTTLGLIEWLTGGQAFGAALHSLNAYCTRIDALVGLQDYGGSSEGGDWSEGTGPYTETTRERAARVRAAAAESASEIANNPTQWAQDYVRQIPPADRPAVNVRIGKYAGKRCVKVNGEPIAFCSTRSQARRLRRDIVFALGF